MPRLNIAMLAVSLVLVLSLVQQSAARSLTQTGQGSTCTGPIPQCEPTRCYLQTVSGKSQNVCERCMSGYQATTDGLNCVCRPGFWHACSAPGSCECKPCNKAMFCPGGSREAKNYAAESVKGLRLSCEKGVEVPFGSNITTQTIQQAGLTTKSERSTKPQDCVPMPGFFLAATSRSTQKAALCPKSSYSLGYGRVRQCLKCQSGTEEKPSAGYTDDLVVAASDASKLRVNRLEVCQVPAGKYIVQNVVRCCPAGSFRTSYSLTTESASRYCFTCPPGVTTKNTCSDSPSACNMVVAGVQLSLGDLTTAQGLAATGDGGLSDMAVNLCPYGTYFSGGALTADTATTTCIPCPFGTTTQSMGATSAADCQIPPGFYVKTSGSGASMTGVMEACPLNVAGQGYYRVGWTSYSDIKAQGPDGTTACTPCGAGILAALTDVDESMGGNDTTKLVAGSSYSCYIEGGWGMVPTGVILSDNTLQFSAVLCDKNTYGVANTTYGLQSTPCKPCQRNLITLQNGSRSYTDCVNPAGFGYSPSGATQCAPGSYAPVGSMQGCVQCPAGRTTASDPTKQIAITDCVVIKGYGIFVGSNPSPAGPWDPSTSGMNDTTKALLPVLPCPVAYYGLGGALDSKCVKCAVGTSTAGEGSDSALACDKCAAGYGMQGATCTLCLAGTYQPGYLGNDAPGGSGFGSGTTCIACSTTRSVYLSSTGNETEFVSDGTTYRKGALGREECVPKTAQLGIDIGTRMFDNTALLTNATGASSIADPAGCMANCPKDKCCFVHFDYAYKKNAGSAGTKQCLHVNMEVNTDSAAHASASAALLFYKMLPSDAIAAASKSSGVEAKAMSSGLYARCNLPTAWTASAVYNSNQIGKILEAPATAGTTTALAACKKKCDMMSTCWGFTVQNSMCQLRGGFDEQDVRSFFVNPDPSTEFSW